MLSSLDMSMKDSISPERQELAGGNDHRFWNRLLALGCSPRLDVFGKADCPNLSSKPMT